MSEYVSACVRSCFLLCVCSFMLSFVRVFVRESVCTDERECVCVCLPTCVSDNLRARMR